MNAFVVGANIWKVIVSAEVGIINHKISEKKRYFLWSDDIAELQSSTLFEMHFCAKRKGQVLIPLENPLKKKDCAFFRGDWARLYVSSFQGHVLLLYSVLCYGGGQASQPIKPGTGRQNVSLVQSELGF